MRYQEITEIIKLPKSGATVYRRDFEPVDREMLRNSRPVSENSSLRYYRDIRSDGQTISIIDPEISHVLGYMSLFPMYNFPLSKAFSVEFIAVHPSYRGRGIARSLYGVALSILEFTLLAGSDQTPGGRRNWLSLNSIPGVEVRGYIPVSDDDFDGHNKEFDELIDIVMELGGEYIGKGTGKYGTTHYFSFDVVPGTGELEMAVKTKLKLYGFSKLTNPGLYAVWTGN